MASNLALLTETTVVSYTWRLNSHCKYHELVTRFQFFVLPLGSENCGFLYDTKQFLFSLVNKAGVSPVKLSPPGEPRNLEDSYSTAIWGCPGKGPSFGAGADLEISDQAASNLDSVSLLGSSYSPPSGYRWKTEPTNTFLAGSHHFTPDEVEVFYESS